jgi:nucleotide sugar dehydrogenase
MKIGIIGHGFVGRAIANAHDRDNLLINDPKLFDSASIEEIKDNTDWIYIAVPTPMSDAGELDTSILETVLDSLIDYKGLVISKCTALPDYYISAKKHYNFRLVHVPEFLTAANANIDYMTPEMIVMGGGIDDCHYYKDVVVQADKTNTMATKFIATDIGTASAMKYYANSFLATKVVFNNQFAAWCTSQGIDWNNLSAISKLDKRLGNTHWAVPGPDGMFGYGGYCFPKDVSALTHSEHGESLSLLKHQFEVNEKIRSIKSLTEPK